MILGLRRVFAIDSCIIYGYYILSVYPLTTTQRYFLVTSITYELTKQQAAATMAHCAKRAVPPGKFVLQPAVGATTPLGARGYQVIPGGYQAFTSIQDSE